MVTRHVATVKAFGVKARRTSRPLRAETLRAVRCAAGSRSPQSILVNHVLGGDVVEQEWLRRSAQAIGVWAGYGVSSPTHTSSRARRRVRRSERVGLLKKPRTCSRCSTLVDLRLPMPLASASWAAPISSYSVVGCVVPSPLLLATHCSSDPRSETIRDWDESSPVRGAVAERRTRARDGSPTLCSRDSPSSELHSRSSDRHRDHSGQGCRRPCGKRRRCMNSRRSAQRR